MGEITEDAGQQEEVGEQTRQLRTILVVDDEVEARDLLSMSFQLQLRVTVITAPNGEEALRILSERGDVVDLVTTDLGMPGMTGLELIKAMQKANIHIPTVVVSGSVTPRTGDGKELITQLEALGITYMCKPYDLDVLIRLVKDTFDAFVQEP